MKYREILLEQLKSQPYFEKQAIRLLSEQYELKPTTVDAYIAQTIKRKEIIQLRKGLYVSADFYNKNKGDISYVFYLANIIRRPSYVSSWTALQYYDMTTEVIRMMTSVTTKVTRDYRTRAGTFAYQSMKPSLFSDFRLEKQRFDFFIASPSKALFDLLYYRTRQFRTIKFEDLDPLIGELRINIDGMDARQREAFYTTIKKHIRHE